MVEPATRPDFQRGQLTEVLLRGILDRDLAGSGLVAAREGMINRSYYAGIIGCTNGALARFRHVFAEYEAEHGITTGPLRHLSDMRNWLAAEYEAGRLDIRGGKLDRTAFQKHFRLRGGTFLTRHQPIRTLFEEFDDRVRREGYLPSSLQAEHQRLAAALAGPIELNKDRLTINQVILAKTAGIPLIRLRAGRFAALVVRRQAEITAQATASRVDPFLHGRVFAFSDLASSWPIAFLERVGIRFKQVSSNHAADSTKSIYRALFDCLRWIGESRHEHCAAVVAEASHGRVKTTDIWEEALFLYRSHLVATTGGGTADTTITQLRSGISGLESGRVVPAMSVPFQA